MSTLERSDTTRNHLANERTFLAWVRTSISIIVFGFVVAKFGLTLHELLFMRNHTAANDSSLVIGIAFMVMGMIIAFAATLRYRIVMNNIENNQFKPTRLFTFIVGIFTAVFGLILVTYLIFAAQSL